MKTLALFLSLLVAVGCGPEKTAKEKTKDEVLDQFEKDIEPLKPLVGQYRGTWTTLSNRTYPLQVEIHVSREIKTVPPDQTIEVPVLRGSFVAIMEEKDPDNPNLQMDLGNIVSGHFENGLVTLKLGGPLYEFVGKYQDGRLEGSLTVRGRATKVSVERISQ